MSESLGKASLELTADLAPFSASMREANRQSGSMRDGLDALAAVSKIATEALQRVKMTPGQGVESKTVEERIRGSLGGVSRAAIDAADHLGKVKLDSKNAAETTASGDVIDRKLKEINRNANEATRALEKTRLAGVGIGPFGSGFGRMGVMGAAIGGGTLLGPAAGPGALGLLAAIPVLAGTGAGALGTLALAFQGVGKAIGGDLKAFKGLEQSQQQFVLTIRSLDGWFDKLKQTAGGALFPGLTAGLKSALSPGTLAAITTAVTEFGHAIGQVAQQAGKYFGSAEFQSLFGPLMAAGARNLRMMGDTMMHLADAVGVLARAAIPLTEWMVKGVDAGTRWADAFLHAKDATGGLAGAMNEAKTSLQLVGRLFASLGKAVYELGAALYPVSKIAVKDLTAGLNYLAGVFKRNRQEIQDIVGGALAAFVAMVKVAVPILTAFAKALKAIATVMGGWKVAFEIVLSGLLAKSLLGIGTASGTAAGEVGGLRAALIALGSTPVLIAIAAAVGAVAVLYRILSDPHPASVPQTVGKGKTVFQKDGKWFETTVSTIGSGRTAAPSSVTREITAKQAAALGVTGASGNVPGIPGFTGPVGSPGGMVQGHSGKITAGLSALEAAFPTTRVNDDFASHGHADHSYHKVGEAIDFAPDPTTWARLLANKNMFAELLSPWGLYNWGVQFYDAKLSAQHSGSNAHIHVAYTGGSDAIKKALGGPGGPGAVTGGGGSTGGLPPSPFGTPPPFTKNLGTKPTVPPILTGLGLLPTSLRVAILNATSNAATSTGNIQLKALQNERADLEKAHRLLEAKLDVGSKKQQAAVALEMANIDGQLKEVGKKIKTNLHDQAVAVQKAQQAKIAAIKASFAQEIATDQSNVTSALSTLSSELDKALQAKLQSYIDAVLALKFFQGTDAHGVGLKTPTEALLAQMQAVDSTASLQDALDAAKKQLGLDQTASHLVYDASTGVTTSKPDAAQADKLSADQKAVEQAQRMIDENNLAILATSERAQADHDYAEAVKAATADEAVTQQKMDDQLRLFGQGLLDGSAKLSDLNRIVSAYGLSVADLSDPTTLLGTDFGGLRDATNALSDVMWLMWLKLQSAGDASAKMPPAGLGSNAAGAAGTLQTLHQLAVSGDISPATYAYMISGHKLQIPGLDLGGTVLKTGLAMVHAGETYSGVGKGLSTPTANIYISGVVGNGEEVAMQVGKSLEKLGFRGIKFQLT